MGNEPFPCRRLCDSGVVLYDCEHKTPPDEGRGYAYLAIPNIRDGRIDLTGVRRISDEQLARWNRRVTPSPGDIVVTRRGRVGDSAPVPLGLECAIGQNLVILRSEGHVIDQNYLRWALRGPMWRTEVERMLNVGAVFDSLNCSDIPKMVVNVPPLPEQRVIAQILGALDDKIHSNTRVVGMLEELMQSEFRACPHDTHIASDVLEPLLGGTPSRDEPTYWGGDIPWATAKDVVAATAGVVMSTAETITPLGIEKSAAKVLPPGRTVITARGTVGALARLGEAMSFNQTCYGLVPRSGFTDLLVYLGMSEALVSLRELTHGTVFDTITKATFASLHLEMPVENQRRTVGDKLAHFDEFLRQRLHESSCLARLRDALLPELLSGRLRVPHAERISETVT